MPETIDSLATEWQGEAVVRLGLTAYHAGRAANEVRRFSRESGIRHPDGITARAVTAWLARIGADGRSHRTQRNKLSAIRSFVRWLIETGRLPADPIALIRLPKAPPGRGPRAFTIATVRRLVALARSDADDPDLRRARHAPARFAVYALLALTGLRIGELRAQLWRDVDLDAATLRVTCDKSRRGDVIALCPEAVAVLAWWRGYTGSTSKVFPSLPCCRTLERDLRRAGNPPEPGDWHRFRKGAITALAEAGVGVWDVTAFARHTDPRVTLRHYVTAADERLRATAAALPPILPHDNIFPESRP